MAKQKRPNIVAELGRPETPTETRARKARDSHLYRSRKTVNNLVFSLLVSVGVMFVIAMMATGLTGGKNTLADHQVDAIALAHEAESGAGRALIAPEVPDGWKAKQARLGKSGDVVYWRIDYTTADQAYAAVVQAFTADGSPVDESWIAEQLEGQQPNGAESLAGIDWAVYDHPERSQDESNMRFGLEGGIALLDGAAPDTILVYGTDSSATLRELATQAVESLETSRAASTANANADAAEQE